MIWQPGSAPVLRLAGVVRQYVLRSPNPPPPAPAPTAPAVTGSAVTVVWQMSGGGA